MAPTKEQLNKAGLNVVFAVTEAIREAREIPAGHLYAAVMGQVTMEGWNKIVGIITNAGLVEKHGDMLRWIGPEVRA